MHGMGKTVNELHAMLKLHEQTLIKKDVHALHVIRAGKGLRESSKLKPGALSLYVGNDNAISVSRNNLVYFNVVPRDGIFEIDLSNSNTNNSSMYAVINKRAKLNLDSALLWHCRLGYISKKCIEIKWFFKKKTDMDGAVHTYKAHLIAKGFTQTYGVDYEETFSSVADIRAIRILIAILIGLCQSAYIEKILKRFHMEKSKRERIPMQEKLKLSKSLGASTPAELMHMQNVPYASAVGSIMNIKDMFLIYEGDIKRELRVSCYTHAGYLTDVRKFNSGLGVVPTIEKPIKMYCDNTRAIAIPNESEITKGARHFRAKVYYLHEVIEYSDIKLEKVHTDDNLADLFTKALAFTKHSEHTKNIRMLSAGSLM
nr:hypothetical protein [Tanacetum cinerariifolium]